MGPGVRDWADRYMRWLNGPEFGRVDSDVQLRVAIRFLSEACRIMSAGGRQLEDALLELRIARAENKSMRGALGSRATLHD
jgi:hypothetical protein